MYKIIKHFITTCDQSQKNIQVKHTREPVCITNTPTTAFHTVAIYSYTVGPFRASEEYRYILTAQCELTKYIITCPIMTKESKSTAKTLTENIILQHRILSVLKSDKGTEFTNDLMNEICKLLNIEQRFSTPYHHETLEIVERNHKVLSEYFLSFVDDENWHSWIPYYAFAYNTTPHVDTEYSPFELCLCWIAKIT